MARVFEPPRLDASRRVVYDAETDGLEILDSKICGHVITAGPRPEESWYFPVRHESGPNYDSDKVASWFRDIFSDPHREVAGHNLKFDLHVLATEGISVAGPKTCTMLGAAICDEHQGRYSLEACAKAYGVQAKKGEEMYQYLADMFDVPNDHTSMGHFWRTPADDKMAIDYAEGDGTTTWQLLDELLRFRELEDLQDTWDLEMELLPVVLRMERRGVRVDKKELKGLKAKIADDLEKARKALPDGFNVRSPNQLRELFRSHNLLDWPTTDKGNPSFKESWLERSEIGRHVISVRKLSNLQSTFIEGATENFLRKGRIHASFNQLKSDEYGTITGRFSSSNPNLQQVPKRDKVIGPLYRRIFKPDPKTTWASFDYSQCEYRIFAYYAQAQSIIDGYLAKPPVDMHQYVAELLSVIRDPTAKRINLGILYGMGIIKLAATLGVSIEQAKEWMMTYHKKIPEAKQFYKRAEKVAKHRGWVKSAGGRRGRFPDRRFSHKASNKVIQMTNADIIKRAMLKVDDYCESTGDADLLLTIHDSLDLQVRKKRAIPEIENIMIEASSDLGITVPMVVDIGTGKNWSEATYG